MCLPGNTRKHSKQHKEAKKRSAGKHREEHMPDQRQRRLSQFSGQLSRLKAVGVLVEELCCPSSQ